MTIGKEKEGDEMPAEQTPNDEKFQYLPEEGSGADAGSAVRSTAGDAAAKVKEALPDADQVKQAAGQATTRVKEALPDTGEVKEAAGQAAARVKEALPDADQVKEVAGKAAAQVKEALPDATQVKEVAGKAAAQVKEALPDATQVKETVAKAAAQVSEVLPDAAEVKEQFLQAAQKLMDILPDGNDLRAVLARTVEAVKTDPTIRQEIEAAADIVAQRLETKVGQGIDAVTGVAKAGAEKIGLEPLEHVAERVGEIAKEGVEEIIDQTKEKALG